MLARYMKLWDGKWECKATSACVSRALPKRGKRG